jgi:hypothetical protein
MVAVATMAGEAMVEWLRDLEGFLGLLMLTDEETGTTQVITLWTDEGAAERSRVAREQLRDRITATVSVEVQETKPYAVSFADLRGASAPTP